MSAYQHTTATPTTYPVTVLPDLLVTEDRRMAHGYTYRNVLLILEPVGVKATVIEVAATSAGFVVVQHYSHTAHRWVKSSMLHAMRAAISLAGPGVRVVHTEGTYKGCRIEPGDTWQVPTA